MDLEKIERLIYVSHLSVINWVKQASDEKRKRRKFNNKKTNILELDGALKKYGYGQLG